MHPLRIVKCMNGIIYICHNIMQKIIQLDRNLFEFVNDHLHNNFLDFFMSLMRNSSTWYPLYIFMLAFVLLNFKKDIWWWVVFAITTVYLSNYISSNLIKENIFRLRPCNDPTLNYKINFLIGYRPQSSSFTSSHACNHFAMATFFYFTLKKYIGKITWLFLLWAAIICFAQVYVGVHFPLDVVSGGIIGYLFGYLSATSFNKRYSLM
jgi:membrane-associated phospholipid phosphatase